jgi:hypothetical protein
VVFLFKKHFFQEVLPNLMEKIKQEHVLGKPTKCNTINNKLLTYGCLFERVTAK